MGLTLVSLYTSGRIRCLLYLTLSMKEMRFLVLEHQLSIVKITFIHNNLRGKNDICGADCEALVNL